MKRLVLGLSIVLLLTVSATASAAQRMPTGPYLSLFPGDQDYPASTAFHMRGGVSVERGQGAAAIGRYLFTLEMDGASVPATLQVTSTPDNLLVKFWYMEFPNGLAGTHSFVGRYWGPCGVEPEIPCNGLRPNTVVLLAEFPATITFVP